MIVKDGHGAVALGALLVLVHCGLKLPLMCDTLVVSLADELCTCFLLW
jgi:hypothetical protein